MSDGSGVCDTSSVVSDGSGVCDTLFGFTIISLIGISKGTPLYAKSIYIVCCSVVNISIWSFTRFWISPEILMSEESIISTCLYGNKPNCSA